MNMDGLANRIALVIAGSACTLVALGFVAGLAVGGVVW